MLTQWANMRLPATENTQNLFIWYLSKALSHTGKIVIVRYWVSRWIPAMSSKQSAS